MSVRGGHVRAVLAAAVFAVGGTRALAIDESVFNDPPNDAVIRRTDSHNNGVILPGQALPDLKRLVISPWEAVSPGTDPYTGSSVSHVGAHLFRIDAVFSGLLNPPGPLGGAADYNPMEFGPSPVYGFFEIDVDHDADTGGDLPTVAADHYLANAARFGGRPHGELSLRAANTSDDLYQTWSVPPQVCLSGADWVLSLCGCFDPTVVYKSDPSAATFGPGATWILSGPFFQRTTAYQGASTMVGANGSDIGLYAPVVNLRFQHDIVQNETTISLVYSLDQTGAWLLAGQPGSGPEPIDNHSDNETSIAEGVQDLIDAANRGGLTGLAYEVTYRWANKTVDDATDTTRWRPTFIVGSAYSEQLDGKYIWTDLGFDCIVGDVNGDGLVNAADRSAVMAFIAQFDGSSNDADGIVNGVVQIPNFAVGFSVFDVDGDGFVGPSDIAFYVVGPCAPDFDRNGSVNVLDIFAFLNAWFSGDMSADYNHDGALSVLDIFDFLNSWFVGC
jgi:hypothetical protein